MQVIFFVEGVGERGVEDNGSEVGWKKAAKFRRELRWRGREMMVEKGGGKQEEDIQYRERISR